MEKRSFTIIELCVLLIVIFLLLFFAIPSIMDPRSRPNSRATCASNLRQIGLGLNCYADENSEAFPAVPHDPALILIGTDINQAKTTDNGQSPWRNLSPNAEDNAFARNEKGAFTAPVKTPTVSASLWLLCRVNMATPKVFVCPSVKSKAMADDPLMEKNILVSPKYFSDFYTDPSAGALISYSFQSPYNTNWNVNIKPGCAIGADENDGTQANSTNHNGKGQNVLHVDSSVIWEISSFSGFENDNIYTALPDNYTGLPKDAPGILSVRPRTKEDSVLIPVKESNLVRWDRKP